MKTLLRSVYIQIPARCANKTVDYAQSVYQQCTHNHLRLVLTWKSPYINYL